MLVRTVLWFNRPIKVVRRLADNPHYDVCIIGGGPGGFLAAINATKYNKSVCLIEKGRVGGCGIWNGALQSKALWEMSRFVAKLSGPFCSYIFPPDKLGSISELISEDRIFNHVAETSRLREQQIINALKIAKVDLIYGTAMFSSDKEIDVHSPGSGEYRVIKADYFIIATGSKPKIHPYFVTDRKRVLTSDEIMNVPIPSSLVIIGAGQIGCEFASIYANLKKTEITLVDTEPTIFKTEDSDVIEFIKKDLIDCGVKIVDGHKLLHLESWHESDNVGGCLYTLKNSAGKLDYFKAERALLAIGRTPNITGLGLENTKISVQSNIIQTDEYLKCTPYDHIFAIGDVRGTRTHVNLAEMQAIMVIDYIYSKKPKSNLVNIPSGLSRVTYVGEPVASVGLNEKECRALSIGYIAVKIHNQLMNKFLVSDDHVNGFCKVIVSNDSTKRLLGCCVIGPESDTVIEMITSLVQNRQSAYDLKDNFPVIFSASRNLAHAIRAASADFVSETPNFPYFSITSWNQQQ